MHLTGRVTVSGPAGALDERDLPGPQATFLLAYLALERSPVTRSALADVLWHGALPTEWASGLNALVSKLRAQLQRVGADRMNLISSAGTLELSLSPDTWVDIESALRQVDRASGAARRGDVAAALPDATAASAVLRRSFLGGVDNLWVDDVRRRLESRLYVAYELLSHGWNRQGDHRLALLVAESAIRLDPLREHGYQLAIEAAAAGGEPDLASRLLQRCRAVFRAELGVEPSDTTLALTRADAVPWASRPFDTPDQRH
jgi:DNA-binding SARP family transcriptional activator